MKKTWRFGRLPIALIIALAISLTSLTSCGIFAARPPHSTDEVRVINNLVYYHGEPADDPAHSLDLFLPRKGKDWPVVVLIHGGAWVLGTKNWIAPLAYGLAENGYAVANINYRLTPRVKHPGHVEDCARAISWTKKNARKYGADPDRLFVMGHSAGGHLASLVSLDGEYLKPLGVDTGRDIAGVVSISGVYRIDNHVLDPIFSDNKKEWDQASPINYITKNSPPFLILFAQYEMQGKIPLAEQAEEFYEAMQDAGVDSKIKEIPGVNHDTIIRSVATNSSQTLESILAFLKNKR